MFGTQRLRIGTLLALAPIVPAVLWATLRDTRVDPPNLRLEVSLSARQLKEIQERIESKWILFKVRVVGRQVKRKSQHALVETRVIS